MKVRKGGSMIMIDHGLGLGWACSPRHPVPAGYTEVALDVLFDNSMYYT